MLKNDTSKNTVYKMLQTTNKLYNRTFSYADEDTLTIHQPEVEEAFDAVAAAEAEAAANAEAKREEAERIIDEIDLDAEYVEESGYPDMNEIENDAAAASGSTISLVVGGILITGGAGVVIASNRKIKKGKG